MVPCVADRQESSCSCTAVGRQPNSAFAELGVTSTLGIRTKRWQLRCMRDECKKTALSKLLLYAQDYVFAIASFLTLRFEVALLSGMRKTLKKTPFHPSASHVRSYRTCREVSMSSTMHLFHFSFLPRINLILKAIATSASPLMLGVCFFHNF